MTMIAYIMASLIAFSLHLLVSRNRIGLLSPNILFGATSVIMLVGTLMAADPQEAKAQEYVIIVSYSSIAYNLVAAFTIAALKFRPKNPKTPATVMAPLGNSYWIAVTISAVVVLLYYQAVGYSAFLEGITASISGNEADVATLRLESYAGSRYLFPGYVNQFKNALLPVLVLLGILYFKNTLARVILAPLAAIAIFGLIGTGQRGAFFIACIVATAVVIHWNRTFPLKKVGFLVAAGLGALILSVSTVALGRHDTESPAANIPVSIASGVLERIFLVNARAGIVAYEYTSSLNVNFLGEDWVKSILSVLPGQDGSGIASQVFATVYGSDRGTIPPSIWGSINHNFGTVGTIFAPAIIAVAFCLIGRAIYSAPVRDGIEVLGISGTAVVLGIWMTDSPLFLLNNGLFVYLALWAWGRIRRLKLAEFVDPTEASGGLTSPHGVRHDKDLSPS